MGEVYKTKDTRLDRSVAIKILPAHLSEDDQRKERFEREARAVSGLAEGTVRDDEVGPLVGQRALHSQRIEDRFLEERAEGLARDPLNHESEHLVAGVAVFEHRARLEARGFRVRTILLIPRPTPLPHGARGWIDVFGQAFAAPVPEAERPAFLDEVCEALRPELLEGDTWMADYVRLRFAADRPITQDRVTRA